LGIFYLDNEKNRRWVVKADNPDLLARINAVFVTVEPRGGSEKPTGKPFLEAYLHSLSPNHP
jgi:anti-sigma-K factor RskA